MGRVRGIGGLPEPTFRTGDDSWVSLDSVVACVVQRLDGDVSPMVAKGVIQMARHAVRSLECVDIGALARDVTLSLRPEHIVVTPPVVNAILLAYVTEVEELGVVQVAEGY
jgi:hypothetical protein